MEPSRSAALAAAMSLRLLRPLTRCASGGRGHLGERPFTPKFGHLRHLSGLPKTAVGSGELTLPTEPRQHPMTQRRVQAHPPLNMIARCLRV